MIYHWVGKSFCKDWSWCFQAMFDEMSTAGSSISVGRWWWAHHIWPILIIRTTSHGARWGHIWGPHFDAHPVEHQWNSSGTPGRKLYTSGLKKPTGLPVSGFTEQLVLHNQLITGSMRCALRSWCMGSRWQGTTLAEGELLTSSIPSPWCLPNLG